MSETFLHRRRIGLMMLIAGLVMTLAFHLLGSWDLLRYGESRHAVASDKLGYDIPYFDLRPDVPEIGRVVILPGFAAGIQAYFPLAISLVQSGYAVRLVAHSGSPNSSVKMDYASHGVESLEAARPFLAAGSGLPHFLIGQSEGTRFALHAASEIPSVDGVVLLSTISSSMDSERPANVLILVAENDFANVKRAAHYALANGTRAKHPAFDKLYGSFEEKNARMAKVVPGTNHVNIQFDDASCREVVGWLNRIAGRRSVPIHVGSSARWPALAFGVLLGAAVAVVGIGLHFPDDQAPPRNGAIPAWAMLLLFAIGWGAAAMLSNVITLAQKIPLLVYGRALGFFAIAALPLLLVSAIRPEGGIGLPRGSWKARMALLGTTLTLLLFDYWLMGVLPRGHRMLWFLLAFFVSGTYFLSDELLRRKIQRVTDWQTGFALGLAGSFIAAIAIAGGAFFTGSPVGQFLVIGAGTLFVILAVCEIPATYLFATTGDWLLSWWVRVSICNGFLAAVVPLMDEVAFRKILP